MRQRAAILAFGLMLATAPAAVAEDGGEDPQVLLIMDASGSMGRVDENGVRLMDGAQEALTSLVDALPEGLSIGLRVYGHRVPNTDKPNGCRDSELVVPVGPLNRQAMKEAIASFGSRGFTPIGLSLQQAAEDLGGSGTIVLVSDGEDTCAPPDPCDIAMGLLEAGFDIRVETVGFFLEDDPAREQLRCIAESTGGSFREVGSLGPLVTELGAIVREVVPEAGNFHLPIVGGREPASAVRLPLSDVSETGDGWLGYSGFFESSIGAGETAWFAVDVEPGRALGVFGAHMSGLEWMPGEALEVVILDPELEDARRLAPRRGMNTVDLDRLGQAMAEGRSLLGASTGTDFHPYGRLEAEEHALLAASGLDEEAYNALWLETMLSERESPPPGGTYYVGFSWDSGRAGAEIDLGWGAYVTHRPAELYGQSYRAVDGALQRTEAVELTPVDGGASFDPYDWPPGAYPNHRSFYAGAMAAGETRWYHQPLVFDEALAVQATLVRGKDAAVDAGTFSVAIYDEDGALLGEPYLSDPTATVSASDQQVTAGVSMAYTGEGEVPYATEAGAWLAVTWNSPIEEAAEVRLVVDVIPRFEGVTPAFRPPVEPGPDAGESAQDETLVVADDPVETNPGGFPVLIVGAVIGLGVLVGGGSWWRRRAVGRG